MSPVIVYVLRAVLRMRYGPDLELVEHLYQLTAKVMKGEQDELGR